MSADPFLFEPLERYTVLCTEATPVSAAAPPTEEKKNSTDLQQQILQINIQK